MLLTQKTPLIGGVSKINYLLKSSVIKSNSVPVQDGAFGQQIYFISFNNSILYSETVIISLQ
jgi:hypothetical protein